MKVCMFRRSCLIKMSWEIKKLREQIAKLWERVHQLEDRLGEIEFEPVPVPPDVLPRRLKGAEIDPQTQDSVSPKWGVDSMYS